MNDRTELQVGLMLIGGELVESESGAWLDSVNPATEELIGRVPAGTKADVERAYQAAAAAQPAWAALTPAARGAYLLKVAAAMRERADEILRVEVLDTGNTITKMKGDVLQAAKALEWFAGLGTELKGESIPASADNMHISIREPYGVVGRIVPFNHPIKFASNAIAGPLMAGNTVIVKPPEQSPLSAGILGEICRDLLPAGMRLRVIRKSSALPSPARCRPAWRSSARPRKSASSM
jgi:betaine-aldehyde dehydrogenase